jgi:hypothetical protein
VTIFDVPQRFSQKWVHDKVVMDQLKKLGELRDAGVLTNQEFDAKKADLLSRL